MKLRCMKIPLPLKYFVFFGFFLFQAFELFGQIGTSIPATRRCDWTTAGVNWTAIGYEIGDPSSTFDLVIHATNNSVSSCGDADPTGVIDNTPIVQCLINQAESLAAASSNPNFLTLIYFEPGTYKFNGHLDIDYGHVVLRGANPSYTRFNFEFLTEAAAGSLFNIDKPQSGNQYHAISKNSTPSITFQSAPTGIVAGDYVELIKDMNEADLCVSGSQMPECTSNDYEYGQVVKVTSVSGNTITLGDPFAIDYIVTTPGDVYNLRVKDLDMVTMFGIEDIKINDLTSSTFATDYNNIRFNYARNCWVSGVESNLCHTHHVSIEHSTNVELSGSYFHHGVDYSAQSYGVYIGRQTTNSLIENNILTHLRHPIVLSTSMPCRNVIGYNFTGYNQNVSNTQEIMLHGYFPTLNLFEGNITGRLDFDLYYGLNGIYNTVFRNYIKNYTTNKAQYRNSFGNIDSVSSFILDNNLLANNNCPNEVCSGNYADKSYYHLVKPDFISSCYTWPLIGPPVSGSAPLSNTNPAETRYLSGGQFTINPKDEFTDYSIENTGLITGFNAIADNPAVFYRNQNDLSIGNYGSCSPFYYNATGYWNVGPVTTAIKYSNGNEEIITSYNNTDGGAAIYVSTNKTNPQVLLWSQANTVVTAIASGNFVGDVKDEIVFAIIEAGIPKLYITDDYGNMEKKQIGLASSTGSVSAIAAGNTETVDTFDELFIAHNYGVISRVYRISNPSLSTSTVGANLTYTNTNGVWDVSAMAVGDFDDNNDDELIIGLNSASGPSILRSETGTSTVTTIYSGINYWTLSALAAGDLDMNGKDELLCGFNSASEGPNIYKSEDGLSAGEVLIYDNKQIYWSLVSMAVEKAGNPGKSSNSELQNAEFPEEDENSLEVYPNPTSGQLTITIKNTDEEQPVIYTLFSLQGEVIHTGDFVGSIATIDISSVSSGLYILTVSDRGSIFTERIVVQ